LIYPLFISFPAGFEPARLLLPFSDLIRLLGDVLPGFLDLWINAYARDPFLLLCVVGLIVVLGQIGARLKRRISDQIRRAWDQSTTADANSHLPNSLTFRFRTSRFYGSTARAMRLQTAPILYASLCAIIFVYVTAIIANRISFLQEDAAGLFCSETPTAQHLAVGETRVVDFRISDFCRATGVLVEPGQTARYYVRFDQSGPWSDGSIPTSLNGYTVSEIPAWRRPILFLAQPFKRVWTRPFFRVVLQVGTSGANQLYLDPDKSDPLLQDMIKPSKEGELFLYVNDVALGIPQMKGYFYGNNSGSAQLTIKRTR
jgi:hypothetical protein